MAVANTRPVYAAKKVDVVPDDAAQPREGPRTPRDFTTAMNVAMDDPGEWYEVGDYQSENGAKNMLKRIQRQDVKVPGGPDTKWEILPRRVDKPDGKRGSKLFAKFLG